MSGKPFKWIDDDVNYIIEVKEGRKKLYFDVDDSYSQWILKHGKDFDVSETIEREVDSDFNYVGIFQKLGGASRTPKGDLSFGFFPFDFTFIDDPAVGAERTEFVARLPLRTRSISSPGEIGKPVYTVPEGIDKHRMVIIGVIDDAINIGHERFRGHTGQSRIDFAWIQDADAMDKARGQPSVSFGRECIRSDIDAAIAASADDDDKLMEELGLIAEAGDPYRPSALRFARSHGTHVCDLAAGYDSSQASAINRRQIVVQLPALASADTSGAALMTSVMEAARFIFERALLVSQTLCYPIPVIVNFSYAFNSGPRAGLHIIERQLRRLAVEYKKEVKKIKGVHHAPPVELVLPAGNTHLSQLHAASNGLPKKGAVDSLKVDLRLQPQDNTSSYVELWFPNGATNMQVDITDPEGNNKTIKFCDGAPQVPRVLAIPRTDNTDKPQHDTVIARIRIDEPGTALGPLLRENEPIHRILLSFAPTEVLDKARLSAPHGIWKIEARANLANGGKILTWIQRDETFSISSVQGRQAYFDDDVYGETLHDRFSDLRVTDHNYQDKPIDTVIKRDGSLSGIATPVDESNEEDDPGQKILVTGGYHWASDAAAMYSAAGSETIEPPLVMCVSDTSRVLPGVLAACTRNGARCVQNGTSVTAPQVTRRLADKIENWGESQREQFDSHDFLGGSCKDSIVKEPPRPSLGQPELASNDVIRKNRVKNGLLKLDRCDDLYAQIERGVTPRN